MDKLRHLLLCFLFLVFLCSSAFSETQQLPSTPYIESPSPRPSVFIPKIPSYVVNTLPIQVKIISGNEKSLLDWISGIAIPMFSAFIGGILALKSTHLTIENQEEKDRESRRLSIKPWLYSYITVQSGSCYERIFYLDPPEPLGNSTYYSFWIKNSDNGLCIIDKVSVDNVDYHLNPGSNVIGKNEIFNLSIRLDKEKYTNGYDNIYFYVKDVDGNSYRYPLLINVSIHTSNHNGRTIGICEDI